MGAAVGGILGGGQLAAAGVANNIAKRANAPEIGKRMREEADVREWILASQQNQYKDTAASRYGQALLSNVLEKGNAPTDAQLGLLYMRMAEHDEKIQRQREVNERREAFFAKAKNAKEGIKTAAEPIRNTALSAAEGVMQRLDRKINAKSNIQKDTSAAQADGTQSVTATGTSRSDVSSYNSISQDKGNVKYDDTLSDAQNVGLQ